MDDEKLRHDLNHFGHLIHKEKIPREFTAREIYHFQGWAPERVRLALAYGISTGILGRRMTKTGGRPIVQFYFRIGEAAPLPPKPKRGGRLAQQIVQEGSAEPPKCALHPEAAAWTIRLNHTEEWGPWHCSFCFPPPRGWGGQIQTSAPLKPAAPQGLNFEHAPVNRPARPQRHEGIGMNGPRFSPATDACPEHPNDENYWFNNPLIQNWSCNTCSPPVQSDSMARWVVRSDAPEQVVLVPAEKLFPGLGR